VSRPSVPSAGEPEGGVRPLGPLATAVVVGYAGVVFLAFGVYWYEVIVQPVGMPQVVIFSLTPIVFFMGFVLSGVVNPILRRACPALAMGRRELVLVFALWLMTGAVCFRQLAVNAVHTIGMARNEALYSKAVKSTGLVRDLPDALYLSPDEMRPYYYGQSPDGRSFISVWPRSPLLEAGDFGHVTGLARRLLRAEGPLCRFLSGRLRPETRDLLSDLVRRARPVPEMLTAELNAVIEGPSLATVAAFRRLGGGSVPGAAGTAMSDAARARANRERLEAAFPRELIQAGASASGRLRAEDFHEPERLARRLMRDSSAPARYLRGRLSPEATRRLAAFAALADRCIACLAEDLNAVLRRGDLYAPERFAHLPLSTDVRRRLEAAAKKSGTPPALGRYLLEEAFPGAILPLPASVPWGMWWRRFVYWVPLMLLTVLLASSLVRMMHRQWSEHELLAYPIGEIADSVVSVPEGRLFPAVFYRPVFWWGFGLVLFIYTLNGLHKWFPQMVYIQIEFEHRNLVRNFPFLYRYCGSSYSLLRGWWWPFMIAIAVLIPREISLSAWLGHVLAIFGYGFYFFATGKAVTRQDQGSLFTGMYLAAFVMILYPGRWYYWRLLRMALGVGAGRSDRDRAAVTACRVYLFCCLAVWVLLQIGGVHWMVAAAAVASFSLLVVLLARMTAEVGLPWLSGLSLMSSRLPLQFLGAAAIGPKCLASLVLVTGVMDGNVGNSIAAQETTYDRLAEGCPAREGVLRNAVLGVGLVIAIAASLFFTVWNAHSFGGHLDGSMRYRLRGRLNTAAVEIKPIHAEGKAAALDALGAWGKLRHIGQKKGFWSFFAAGFFLIAGCGILRHRKAWWPLHPLPLLLANTWTISRLYHSFFVGWVIKTALIKLWGGEVYRRSRPFFFGAVLGQIVGCGVLMVVDTLYHYLTWQNPGFYRYFA